MRGELPLCRRSNEMGLLIRLALVCFSFVTLASCLGTHTSEPNVTGQWEYLAPDSISGVQLLLKADSGYQMQSWHFDVITNSTGCYSLVALRNRPLSQVLVLVPDSNQHAPFESIAPPIEAMEILRISQDSWSARLPSGAFRLFNRMPPPENRPGAWR